MTSRLRFAVLDEGRATAGWHRACLDHLGAVADRVALDDGAPDFVLKLGRGPVAADAGPRARYGLWHFEHESAADGGTDFVHATFDDEPVTVVRLLARGSPGEADRILLEGRLATDRKSAMRQAQALNAIAAEWPLHACRRIMAAGWDRALGPQAAPRPAPRRPPGAAALAMRLLPRRLAFAWRRYFRHLQWNVGVLRLPDAALVTPGAWPDDGITWCTLQDGEGFLADPFGAPAGGRTAILCEHYPYREGRGRIVAMTWDGHGFAWAEHAAIAGEAHLSYPCLVEEGGTRYCIPEASQAGEIAAWRAVDFPSRWERWRTLLPGFAGVDPTVFRHEGRWWLLCTRRGADADAALWIWHAASLEGPWTPHVLNPVKIDVTSARPGGPAFVHDGALYRPTQDCSRCYGWRLGIQRIDELTPDAFAETQVACIEAGAGSAYPLGRHTIARAGDVLLVDGHREVFLWRPFVQVVRATLRDLRRRLLP